MTPVIVALTVAYVGVAALLLNLNLATQWGAAVKIAAIVLVTGMYAASWHGLHGLLGWATYEPLPSEFKLHWITVDEPDKTTGAEGSIYFWVRELDEAQLPKGAPRSHRVAWSEEVAEAAQAALEQLEKGQPLNGFVTRQLISPGDVDPMAEQIVEGEDYYNDAQPLSGDDEQALIFEFRRVPPPDLPAKPLPAGPSG